MLGYLLHNRPARAQTFSAPVGDAHLSAPETVFGVLALEPEPLDPRL